MDDDRRSSNRQPDPKGPCPTYLTRKELSKEMRLRRIGMNKKRNLIRKRGKEVREKQRQSEA
jgi:hypothetical protein